MVLIQWFNLHHSGELFVQDVNFTIKKDDKFGRKKCCR